MKREIHVQAFTLLELLIVVIILGILAAIALPQYIRTIDRGRASEAIIHLGTIRTGEIEYYAQHRSYTEDWGRLEIDNPNELPNPPVGTRIFNYSITVAAPDTFTASAVNPLSGEVVTMNEFGRITRYIPTPQGGNP
mgnify:CR=1 FL=1